MFRAVLSLLIRTVYISIYTRIVKCRKQETTAFQLMCHTVAKVGSHLLNNNNNNNNKN